MRIIIHYLIPFILITGCNVKNQFQDNTEVVQYFIETKINQRTFDIRIFDPPPPPELQDSVKHNGRIKSDSIIEKLAPLQVYVDSVIEYDDTFKPKAIPIEAFAFIESKREKGGNVIAIESLPEKKDIQLNWISSEDFFKLYKSINLEEGYGGFVSFKNLYFSIDGKKAYFEFTYFRRKMSSSTSVVYAEKQDDGSWIFSTELVSMS